MKKLKATERTSIIGRRTGVNVVSGRKIRAKEDGTDEFEDYWTESDSEQSTVSVASLASERGRSDDVSQRKSRAVSRSFTKSPGRKSLERSSTRKRKDEEFQDRSCNTSIQEISFRKDVSKTRRDELSINGTRATDDDTANTSLCGVQKSPAKSIQKKRSERFEDDNSDSSVEGSTTRKGEGEEFEDHVSNNSSPENSFTANVSKGRRAELSINGSRTTRKATATDGDTANKSLAGIQKSPVKRFEKNRSRSEPFEDGSSDSSLERSTTQKKQNEEIEDHMSNNSSPEKSFTANVSKGRRAELSENRTRATRTAVASDGDTADKNKVRKSPFRRVHKRRSENYEDGSSNCSLERSTAQERNDGEFEDDSSSNSSPEKSFRADDSIVTRAELSKNGIGASRSAVPSDGDAVDKNVSGVQKSPVERVRKRKSVSFKDVSINSRAVSSPNWKRKGEEFEDHGSRPEKSFRTDVSKVIGAELSKNKTRASRNAIESDGDTVDKNLSGVRVSPVERVQKRRSEQFENISSNSRAEPSPTREKKDEEFEDHANNSVPEKSFRANASKVGKAALSVNSRARATRNLFTPDGDTVDKNLTRVRKSPVQRVQKGRSEQFEDASSESSSERSPTRERKDEELENRRSPRLQNSVREKTLRSRGSRVRWADLSENGTGVTRNAVASDGDADDNNLLGIQMSPVESVQKRRTEQFEDACSDSSLERSPTLERKDEELKSVKSNISIREKSFREDVSKVRRAKLSKNGTPSTGDAIAADGDKNLTGVRKSPVKRVMKRRSENFEDGRSNSGSESSLRAEASKRRSTSASSAAENVQLSDNLVASDSAGQPHPTQVPTSSAAKRKKKKKRGFGNKLRSGSSDGKSGVSTHGTVQTPSTSEYAQTSDLVPGTGAKRSSTAQRRIDFSETSDAAEQDQQPGFRRSSRKRIPPVAGWLNARCVPFLKASGDISVVYEEGTKEDSFAVNRLKKKYIRNQTKKKKMKSRGKAKQATTLEKTRVVDERTQKSHNLFIHRPFNLYDWTCPTTTDDRDPAVPYRITKGFSCKTISFGFVDIIAHCTKDPQYSPTDNLHFVVLNGDVDVTISNTLRTHTKYDSFIVPTGASYSITNNGPSNALLSFCTFKAPFFSYQE